MSRLDLGTEPKQVLPPNGRRTGFEIEYPPASVISGNTGIVFGAAGVPPGNTVESNQYDFTLIAGATHTRKLVDGQSPDSIKQAIWLQAENTDQVVIIREYISDKEEPTQTEQQL